MVELITSPVRDEQILVAVVIVINENSTMTDTCRIIYPFGNGFINKVRQAISIGVAIVAIQVVGTTTVCDEQVNVTVVIVISPC